MTSLPSPKVFTTGTCGELTPVRMIDGRVIGEGGLGPVTAKLQEVYHEMAASLGESIDELEMKN